MYQDQRCYVGLDLGGTNNKIVILSHHKIDIEAKNHLQVIFQNKTYHLLAHSFIKYDHFEEYLSKLKKKISQKIQLVGTGGGSTLYSKMISQILETPIKPMSQFDAHAKGLEMYALMKLPISIQTYSKNKQEITFHQSKSILQHQKQLLFISFGSGVNFQLYCKGDQGYQRQKAKDIKITLGDGFFLQGTCLGAGYLMGLGRMLTGEQQYQIILSKMKTQEDLRQYYKMVMVNLFQMALNQCLLHQKQLILMSGSILSFEKDIKPFVNKSFELYQGENLTPKSYVRFDVLQGFLGSLGALYTATR